MRRNISSPPWGLHDVEGHLYHQTGYTRGLQISQKSKSYLELLGARREISNDSYEKHNKKNFGMTMLKVRGATMENLEARRLGARDL
jgi:hypothetical protein